jgi:predicted HAD superfamily hydrolase
MVTDGEDVEENMNVIVTEYNDLHSMTGGHIEEEKRKFYAYQWKIRLGRKVIKNAKKIVVINDKNL